MMKKICLLSLVFILTANAYAQGELNAYKYIIIPKKYDFLKRENQYRLNTLTKHMFDEEGFTTVLRGGAYPEDLMSDPCLALTADIDDNSNLYKTKLNLVLLDCHDNVVFTSVEGTSKIKQYDKTYIDALEKSFVSVKYLNYKYDPNLKGNKQGSTASNTSVPSKPVEEVAVSPEVVAAASVTSSPSSEETSTKVAGSEEVEPNKAAQETTSEQPPTVEPKQEVASSAVAEPAAKQEIKEPVVAAAVAVPVVESEKEASKESEAKPETVIARNYENENISFFLIQQGGQLVAYVNESKNAAYKKGELIGTFEKTSVPNFFRVSWKKKEQDIDETMAYFDESGNLKIDIHRNGKIEVITFSEVKE